MKINLNVSGFDIPAVFPDNNIVEIHEPLVEKLTRLYHEKKERVIVFLCAPPGSGKSTLAAFWEYLSQQEEHLEPLQVLPFDGFHYPNTVLDKQSIERNGKLISLRSIKGADETFDLPTLTHKLKQLKTADPKWPYYDRNLHDPVEDAISVSRNIVVVEGNWLLLDKPEWKNLSALADLTIFIDTKPHFLQERLVNRKIKGGSTAKDALAFYQRSDAINVEKVLNSSIQADLNLFMERDGSFKAN